MPHAIFSATLRGLNAQPITVETSLTPGIPGFIIVGLPDTSVQESRERVKTALRAINQPIPPSKIIVNLAPADTKKIGPAYDVPIAISILAELGTITLPHNHTQLFIGELSLQGNIRPTIGILSIAIMAKKLGFTELFLPESNTQEASLVPNLTIYPINHLSQLINHLSNTNPITPLNPTPHSQNSKPSYSIDFSAIKGQSQAKRALEISAAGAHNLLLSGPPGSGKTLLARALPSILPDMTTEETLEVTTIHSISGLTNQENPLITTRPFRTPHHTSSPISLIGGGSNPKPGEISLAHRGVLFLDEFPEFSRLTLENLRQPLEDHEITISRAYGTFTYPSHFMLIAAQNPCPCGYSTDPTNPCTCRPEQIIKYQKKISGPLLDRIDMIIEVPKLLTNDYFETSLSESSSLIRTRVQQARNLQTLRFSQTHHKTNSEIPSQHIEKYITLTDKTQSLIKTAATKLNLSARVITRILKVSRTIADLAQSETIEPVHLAEALQYRDHSISRR